MRNDGYLFEGLDYQRVLPCGLAAPHTQCGHHRQAGVTTRDFSDRKPGEKVGQPVVVEAGQAAAPEPVLAQLLADLIQEGEQRCGEHRLLVDGRTRHGRVHLARLGGRHQEIGRTAGNVLQCFGIDVNMRDLLPLRIAEQLGEVCEKIIVRRRSLERNNRKMAIASDTVFRATPVSRASGQIPDHLNELMYSLEHWSCQVGLRANG
ncbi:hypothetical protein ACFQQB_64900 [Nonomuraea rubra]|uniref:hypothetical protein n=1 Tax=Nonomuraea rubra TaxID=46180 RepID=UPI00360EF138